MVLRNVHGVLLLGYGVPNRPSVCTYVDTYLAYFVRLASYYFVSELRDDIA